MGKLELWGGVECTVNRVRDATMDQIILSGHEERIEDLDLFAALGIHTLRYPLLWERIEKHPGERDFAWTDARVARLGALAVRIIAGLVHHGSGPRWTDLTRDDFAPGLAAHARAVAERYPHLDAYTPVNEPLTTARFSCLYGHWHPHARSETQMWRALLNQIDATRLAMREIRAVNPAARLVQTDDLGFTHSVPHLAYQAAHENARRWMTWDLLEGRVTRDHPLHGYLARQGFADRLAIIADDPCPADVIGINHYLTSERFLDSPDVWPAHLHGGNGRDVYVDVEAVRIRGVHTKGIEGLLVEAADRYARPVALTECHNGCTREEQMRWFLEAWRACEKLRGQGREIVACTAWSLLGAYDWCSLLTRQQGRYESGVFDVRSGRPRPTAMAGLLADLAAGRRPSPFASSGPGWWRRPARYFGPVENPDPQATLPARAPRHPILILGASGTLGQAFARACHRRGLAYLLASRAECPLDDATAIVAALARVRPLLVVNAAGFVRVDEAERTPEACLAANARGAIALAAAAAALGAPCVSFSSDLVFNGMKAAPYLETDGVAPLNIYGASKAQAERDVLAGPGANLVVRTAAFFQAHDPYNFARATVASLHTDGRARAPDDLVVSTTHVPELVDAVLDLAIDGAAGLHHLANDGAVSWADFARLIAAAAGEEPGRFEPCPAADFGWTAPRPANAALASLHGRRLGPLEDAIARFAADLADQ